MEAEPSAGILQTRPERQGLGGANPALGSMAAPLCEDAALHPDERQVRFAVVYLPAARWYGRSAGVYLPATVVYSYLQQVVMVDLLVYTSLQQGVMEDFMVYTCLQQGVMKGL